eukprot:EG_transcript_1308
MPPKKQTAKRPHLATGRHARNLAEERVAQRLQGRLAGGPQSFHFLEYFLADPSQGGCAADVEVVHDWEAFASRHPDTFQITAVGQKLMLSLLPKPKEAARPPQPAAWGADAASSPPVVGRLVASAQVNDSVTMGQVRNVLLRAIEDCAVFPVSLKVLQLAMAKANASADHLLKNLGYGPQQKYSFRDFVELTLLTFPERLQDYSLQEVGPTTLLTRRGDDTRGMAPPADPSIAETVEERVVRRLRQTLQGGSKSVIGLRAFLGDPTNGGCKDDCVLLHDWKAFVLRHADTFSLDESGRLPLISLRPSSDPPTGGPPTPSSQPPPTGQGSNATSLEDRNAAGAVPGTCIAIELPRSNGAVPLGPTPTAVVRGEPSPAAATAAPPSPSQLLVKLVGPEMAARMTQRTTAPTPTEAAAAGDDTHSSNQEAPPAVQEAATADPGTLADVSRHLCDVLRALSDFPVELKAVARQLERRCPGVKAIREGGGFPPTHRGFAEFMRRTIDDHPIELCGVKLAMGANSLWEVIHHVGSTPPTNDPSPVPSPQPPTPPSGPPSLPPPSPDPGAPSPVSPPSAAAASSSSPPADDPPPSTPVPPSTSPTGRFCLVTDRVALDQAISELRALYEDCEASRPSPAVRHLALAWEELLDEPFALCGRLWLATPRRVYAMETEALGTDVLCAALQPFLGNQHLHKAVHGSASTISLRCMGFQPAGLLDTELAYEHLTGELLGTVGDVCRLCGVPEPTVNTGLMDQEALMVSAVAACYKALVAKLGAKLEPILRVSEQRTKAAKAGAARLAWFDVRHQCRLSSADLLLGLRPDDALPSQPLLQDVYGVQQVLGLLPPLFQPKAVTVAPALTSIVLDLVRRPEAFCGDRQVPLADGPVVVTLENLVHVVAAVGPDRLRSGSCTLPGTLNRVSVIRNPQGVVIGLTIRIVRPVVGLAALLSDVLLGQPDHSVLVLGESSSGKTSIVRDVACLLSRQHHTVVVDTFNDVGGDGDLPLPSLGNARRLRVPPGADQRAVMEECMRNHRPRVMVVDEIGREAEVAVARIAKQRGVRLVAGVAGTLEQLLRNRPLAGLLGGVETVVSPDGTPVTQRVAPPLFECIVRVRRGPMGDYMVIHNVAEAVDLLLQG